MSLLTARGGAVHIRVGGNTQDYATMVDSLPDGKAIEKDKSNTTNPVRVIRSYRPVYPILTIILDTNTSSVVHARDLVHARQRIVIGQRKVVFRYVLHVREVVLHSGSFAWRRYPLQ